MIAFRHFAEQPPRNPDVPVPLFNGFRVASRVHYSFARVFDEGRTTMTPKTIHFHQTTRLTPEQYIAGLTDFGPGRSKLFGNSADEYLKVHSLGRSEADVTEGSGGIWERLHYDWSNPNHVVLTTTDSNTWGGDSGHTYNFRRNPNGTTDIDVVVVREGKTFKGRLLGLVLKTVGKGVLEKAFENSVRAIESRSSAAADRVA
jgi:hypothetical protein